MRIYLDHNATTPPLPEVQQAMIEAIVQGPHGNPSSLHQEGRASRDLVETARLRVAALLAARPEEIVFTSGGTEGNNTAVLGAARESARRTGRRDQVVSSPLEHPSVLQALRQLQEEGFPIVLLPVDRHGRLDPDDLRRALDRPTALCSLSLANHEIGNVYPIAQLSLLCREHRVPLHCDAVQAAGRVLLDAGALGADLLTLSGHKLHGPKGIGALYVRAADKGGKGTSLSSLLLGGQQEKGRRAGTENVPGIAGLGVACELAQRLLPQRARHIAGLRNQLERQLLTIPGSRVHGDPDPAGRVPGTCNVGFDGVEGDLLMMDLDLRGVAVSTGAACSSGSPEPSPVLRALGLPAEQALQGVRFSIGGENTDEQINQVAGWVRECVERVRSLAIG